MEAAFKNQPGSALMEVWLECSAATVGFFETCPIYGNRKRRCLLPPTCSHKKCLEEQSPSSPPGRFYSAPSHPRSPPPVAPDSRSCPHSPCTSDRRCGGCEGVTERLALREEGSGDDSGRSRTGRVGEEEGDRSSRLFLRYRVEGRRQRRFRLPQIGQVSKKPMVAAEDSSRTSMRVTWLVLESHFHLCSPRTRFDLCSLWIGCSIYKWEGIESLI